MRTLKLARWETPATSYPRAKVGRARIGSHAYRRGFYNCYGVGGYDVFRAAKPLTITNLRIGRQTWMVDDPPHWFAIQEHATSYHGHVLVAGLGLGLIVHALAENPAVIKITVVEIERDVIDLVGPLVPRCEIVHSDFWEWKGRPDGVFFDLFVGDGREMLGEAMWAHAELTRRFECPVRILGYRNEKLAEMTCAMLEAHHVWEEYAARASGPDAEAIRRLASDDP